MVIIIIIIEILYKIKYNIYIYSFIIQDYYWYVHEILDFLYDIIINLLPETILVPSALKATDLTRSVCPCNVFIQSPVVESHTLTVLS